jgi:tetratricopeptide (TPR) repeat protein
MYYVEKGVLCYRVKLFDEGIRALESASKLAPASPDIFYLSGLIYVQTGDKVKAKECFEKAVSLGHPNAADALKEL